MKTNSIVAKIQVSRARDSNVLITDLSATVDDGVEATEYEFQVVGCTLWQ